MASLTSVVVGGSQKEKTWGHHLTVLAPNGEKVPVVFSDVHKDSKGRIYHWDSRDIVLSPQFPAKSTISNSARRALSNFNYEEYGFVKIGDVYLDPSREIDVLAAKRRLENSAFCIIL